MDGHRKKESKPQPTVTLDEDVVPIAEMLNSIERYNPRHLNVLEGYIRDQATDSSYDLDCYLAVLKLYHFHLNLTNMEIVCTILLKTLANLPHTDFVMAKCLLHPSHLEHDQIKNIIDLHHRLEQCDFRYFWTVQKEHPEWFHYVAGFEDYVRKFVSHVVGITFQSIKKDYLKSLMGDINESTLNQWAKKNGWKVQGNMVFIASQNENIKTKNVTEKIEFDNLAPLMASCL